MLTISIVGEASWQKDYSNEDQLIDIDANSNDEIEQTVVACADHYNQGMIEKLGNTPKIVVTCLLIAGLLLDGVCYRLTHLVVIVFYLECALIVTLSFVPSTLNESTLIFAIQSSLSVIFFACHARSTIIVATIMTVLI